MWPKNIDAKATKGAKLAKTPKFAHGAKRKFENLLGDLCVLRDLRVEALLRSR
jgi:hypothetical protein